LEGKQLKSILKNISFGVALMVSCNVYALTAEGGTRKVERVFFDSDGDVFVAFNPAPDLCEGGDRYRMHAKVSIKQPNHKELVAALLTAYAVGITLKFIWVEHIDNITAPCSDSHYLRLLMIEYSSK